MNLFKITPKNQFEKNSIILESINAINEGEIDPLKALAALKHLETIIESIKSDENVSKLISNELDKYGKGEKPTALGFEITQGQRKNYDYSNTGDVYLDELKEKAKSETDKVKEREKFLQTLKQKVFDSENGGFEINPPIVKYTSYFILKEVKQGIELPNDDMPF